MLYESYVNACEALLDVKQGEAYLPRIESGFEKQKKHWIYGFDAPEKSGISRLFSRSAKIPKYDTNQYLYYIIDACGRFWGKRNSDGRVVSQAVRYDHTGLYEACLQGNLRIFQDALYQQNRLSVLDKTPFGGGGFDHCAHIHSAIMAFAAGDIEVFEKLLPRELGPSQNGYRLLVPLASIFMGLYYRDENILREGKKQLEKALNMKSMNKIEIAVLRYASALVNKSPQQAGEALEEIIRRIPNEKEYWVHESQRDAPLAAYICPFLHGLYNFAYYVWDGDLFAALPRPASQLFFGGYADYLIAANFPAPKPYLEYQGELAVVNKILPLLPTQENRTEYKRIFTNNQKLKSDLLEMIDHVVDLEANFWAYNKKVNDHNSV